MEREMSSRERTLAAISHEEADRVPLYFIGIAPLQHLWSNMKERIDVLHEMGVDEQIGVGIGPRFHPDVTIRDWFDDKSDPEYRLACREYDTPKGKLRVIARCTQDCSYANGVPLASDHTVSRGVEFLVKGKEDLPKLAYLFQEPTKEQIERFRASVRNTKKYADEKGIIVQGDGGPGGVMALHLCGENMYYIEAEQPGFMEEFTELIYKADLKCMEIILEEGVDTIRTNGCYETAPMWSPKDYDEFFTPWLKKKADLAHQYDTKLTYFSTGDFVPHMDSLLYIGMDIINAVRPFYGGINNMRVLKEKIGHRVCLWGGINPEEVIEAGTPDQIRGSVIDAILAAGQGGGLVLSTGGSIFFNKDCYDNVITVIEAVHEYGRYPIDVDRLEAARKKYSYIDLS